jgi:hypothetical protein
MQVLPKDINPSSRSDMGSIQFKDQQSVLKEPRAFRNEVIDLDQLIVAFARGKGAGCENSF